ncbi:hypothetical protein ACOXVJ_07390 [Pseudomonas knackmussii]|uniref:hypothetical protein n=1 Tax=Pseudomonas knackmussii TaxID=65741 RepID=UPI003BE92E5B
MQFFQSAGKSAPIASPFKQAKNTNFYAEDILVALILLLSPIANLASQGTALGIFGASAAAPFVALLSIFTIYKSIKKGKIKRSTVSIIIYASTLTLIYLLFIPQQIKDETTLLKSIKVALFYTFSLLLLLIDNKNLSIIKMGAWGGLVLCILSTLPSLSEISFLNYEGTSEGRPRGLTMEASHFAFISGAIALLIFSIEERIILRMVSSAIGATLLTYCQSKAGLIFYALGFYLFFATNAKSKKHFILTSLLILISSYFIIFVILPSSLSRISNDMDNYTSTATRLVGLLSAILVVIHNPFGVGFGAYLYKFLASIPSAIELSRTFLPYLDYSEVIGYTTQKTTRSISTKSFLADTLIYFGVPFIIFTIRKLRTLISNILKNNRKPLIPAATFLIMSLSFWSTGIGFYPAFILISIIFKISKKTPLSREKTIYRKALTPITKLPTILRPLSSIVDLPTTKIRKGKI